MNLSLMLLEQILVMTVYILFGFLIVKFHILKGSDSTVISALVVFVICPALLLDAFQVSFSREKMYGFLLAVLASILMHILFLVFTFGVGKIMSLNEVEKTSIIYSNCGNLLVPLIGAILGKDYVLYCSAFMAVQNVLLWTHGAYCLGGRTAVNPKKIITNPNIIALTLGLILFCTGIRIPGIPGMAIAKTGACVGPISMIVIGIIIGSADLRSVFTNWRSYLICFMRLILIPLLTILMLWITRLPGLMEQGPKILYVSFLAAAAPTAANITQLSNLYGGDSVLAGSINILSVFFCILTMPLMTIVYQWVFL